MSANTIKQQKYFVQVQGTEFWIRIRKSDLIFLRKSYRLNESTYEDGDIYVTVDTEPY